MKRYRKRPVVVEAARWRGPQHLNEIALMGANIRRPESWPDNNAQVYDALHDTWVAFRVGDWVIKGVQGEFYPCTDEVFKATYEKVAEEEGGRDASQG
jgi:hypothetical protein